jgi:hypothetical protein
MIRPKMLTEPYVAAVPNQNSSATCSIIQQEDNHLSDPALMLSPHFDQNGGVIGETSFSDVFDSLNWVFDGVPDSFDGPPIISIDSRHRTLSP